MEDKILIDIEFNQADIQASVQKVVAARTAIDNLLEANKKLAAQGEKNSATYVQNEAAIKKLNSEVNNNSKIIQANSQANKVNADSIEDLKKRNSELLKERNKLSTSTEEGRKKIAELNLEYDKNSKVIAENSTKVEQQRFNIGNYQSALDGVVPGVGAFTQAQEKATVATNLLKLSFGPVVLIIGAIAAALGILLKSFFGTQEGMDKLSAVTRVFGAIMDRVTGVLQELGGKVFKTLSSAIKDPVQAFKDLGNVIKENVIARFEALALFGPAIKKLFSGDIAGGFKDLGNAVIQAGTGIENAIDKVQSAAEGLSNFVDEAVAQGQRLDELQKQIERGEINQIKRRKELELIIKQQKAIVEDETKTYEAREAAALKAKQAQAESLGLELSLMDKRIEKIKLQQSLNDTSRADEKELAELEAERLSLQATATEQGIEFSKKIVELRKKQADEELAVEKNLQALRLESVEDGIEQEIAKIQSATADKIAALKGSEEQIAEQRKLLKELELKSIAEIEEQFAKDAVAKSEEESKKRDEIQKALLDQALVDYQEYVQGLINAEKEKLLQGLISQEEYDQELSDLQIAALEVQQAIKEDFGEQDIALEGRIADAKIAQKTRETEAAEALEKRKVDAVQNTLGQVAGLFNKNSVAFKALASAQALIQTYQSAQAVFTGMTSTIPGPVGIALGIAGAAAAIISGLANVAKINQTKIPKLAEGGMLELSGPRHSQGGMDVTVGGKRVANVEGGENMVILKRGTSPLLKNLANINMLAGGRDFYSDRAPRYHNQDGGFVARSIGSQVSNFQNLSIAEDLKNIKIFTSITELDRVRGQVNRANFTSELS